ncbi:MAG: hypothetical protein Q9213_001635 [Squamulea squamosa]
MGLVDYSESDGSEAENKPEEIKTQKHLSKGSKPAFQKVVDRSNPHKIRVNLPEVAEDSVKDKADEDGPPAKKARVGVGAFTGFNSFLPAPKRATATNGGANGGVNEGAKGTGLKRAGLGSGVSLKTGATPGFTREPMPEPSESVEEDADAVDRGFSLPRREDPMDNTSNGANGSPDLFGPHTITKAQEEPKKQGNAMMFKPLSVARKPQKRKPNTPNGDATVARSKESPAPSQPKPAPKVSLFSTESNESERINSTASSGPYQPMIYGADKSSAQPSQMDNPYMDDPVIAEEPTPQSDLSQEPQSLDTIASNLNLSASAKRQLLGRQNRNASAINVVNFNTDQEYAANELLRQAGEQVQHNPVRAIAPGKHSLKQLVNAASNQKDALEEQFASGRRNKKEAGSKYGW